MHRLLIVRILRLNGSETEREMIKPQERSFSMSHPAAQKRMPEHVECVHLLAQ